MDGFRLLLGLAMTQTQQDIASLTAGYVERHIYDIQMANLLHDLERLYVHATACNVQLD